MFLRRPRSHGRLVVVVVAALLAGASGAAAARQIGSGPAIEATLSAGQSPVVPEDWYGRVLAQDNLEPVAGARIFVEPVPPGGLLADLGPRPGAREDAVTGSDGAFALDAPPDRRLRVTAPGFLDGFVLLYAGRDNDLARLILRRELSFSGRVLLAGRPAAGVVVLAPAYRRNSVSGTPTPETVSDDAGRFRLTGLRPEQFRELVFIARGMAESKEMARLGDPLETRHYELGDVALLPRVELGGIVVDGDGAPVADAVVSVTYSDAMRVPASWQETGIEDRLRLPQAASDARGSVSLMVTPGQHSLEVFHPTAGLGNATVRVAAAEPDSRDVRLQLEPHVSVRGRVVDEQGNALAGARLAPPDYFRGRPSLTVPEDFYRAMTDEDGCYRVRSLRESGIYFEVHLPGYATRRVEIEVADGRATPPPGDGCDDVAPIVLSPGARLQGKVVNQSGAPVAGATVHLQRHQSPGGYLRWAEIAPMTTGDDGTFLFEGLPFGDYSMWARAPGHAYATIDNLPIGPLPTDPDADRIDDVLGDSSLTRVAEAEVYSLDVTLYRLEPNVSHEVAVFDARGVPEPEASVDPWLRDGDPDLRAPEVESVFTGADGRAILPELLPGTYTMTARAPESHDYGSVRADHAVQAEGFPTVLTMPEHPPLGELHGRYVGADGRGIAGAVMQASGTFRRRSSARTITAADGSFRFDTLPYATYVLKVEHEDLPPVVHPQPVDLDAPRSEPVEIVVPAFGAIEGIVSGLRSDDPAGVSVSFSAGVEVEGGARQSAGTRVQAAEDGTFRVADLAPGTWNVHARDATDRSVSTTVELAPGEVLSGIELPLPSGFTLTGSITWRGEPPERAWISGAGSVRGVELEDPTAFELRDVRPGEHQLEISGTGLRSPYFVYTRIEGDSHIDIVIEGGAVNGIVVDADSGAPIGGALVVSNPVPQLVWDGHEASRRTDRNGVFHAGPFPAGSWRFGVSAPGYAPRAPEIDIGAVDIDDYVIELQPTRDLEIRLPGRPGLDSGRLYAAWYDEATGEVVSAQYLPAAASGTTAPAAAEETTVPAGAQEMTVRWPDGPTGRGVLSVTASRLELAARVEVEISDGPVDVTLEPTGNIQVVVPELADHRPIYALVRIFDQQGRPVPDSFATSHRMFRQREGPQHLITNLVPGRYRVEVETSDGRAWSGEAEVRAHEDAELVLR